MFELLNFDAFSATAVFCFTSSTSVKTFLFEEFFNWGNKKKLLGVRSGEWRWWAQRSYGFGSETDEHSGQCGQAGAVVSHSPGNGQMC